MVSSFSNSGFPHAPAHLTRLPAMDARLSAVIDSFEASMRAGIRDVIREAMDYALTAIHKAVNHVLAELCSDLTQSCRDLALGVEVDSDPALMCSAEIASIEVGHQKLQNGDGNPLQIPSTIHDHSIPSLLLSSLMLRALASSLVKSQLKESVAATIPLQHFEKPMPIAMVTTVPFPFSAIVGKTAALSQLADQDTNVTTHIEGCEDHKSFKLQIICPCMLPSMHTNTTKRQHKVLTSMLSNFTNRNDKWYWILQFIMAYYTGVIAIMYEDFFIDKCGWVNWYLVGKFVMKNFYALHLFDEMSRRHNMENMSFNSNLKALDIVVLVCRYWSKDLVASFTEENGTLGHIHVIKQFLCLSLLHICALTVMAISQLHYSIFTSLLLKLNQEFCNRVDVHLDVVSFPNCVENDQIFQQSSWCHKLNDPCDNISYQRVVFNKRNNTKWLMEKPCILSFTVVKENGKRKAFGFVTSIIRLLEESANLKGLKDGRVGQE